MAKGTDARARFSIGLRLHLTIVVAAVLLSALLCYADSRDADLVKEGTDALNGNEFDIAIARFSRAILINSGKVEAWSGRGEAYALKGDQNRAQVDCAQAIKLAPNSSQAHRRCGFVYYQAADYQRAVAEDDTALRLDPRNALAYAARGADYLQLKQIDRAISDFDQAVRLDPSQSDTYALRGNAWLVKGNFDRAWDDYNRAIEADPKNAFAYVCRGRAAAQRYAFDEAIADYNAAVQIDPNFKAAYRYRDQAKKYKTSVWWGKITGVFFGVAALAILFAAFRAYRSPTALNHSVELHFQRTPDGRLLFYPRLAGTGYIVPDSQREQALRVFARREGAAGLVSGIVGIILLFVLMPITWPLTSWLIRSAGISRAAIIPIGSIAEVSILFGGVFGGFWLWRRAAIRGLVEMAEKQEALSRSEWLDALILDMPITIRCILALVAIFVLYQSLAGLWRMRDGLSRAGIQRISFYGWWYIAMDLIVLCWFLWLLAEGHRLWRSTRTRSATERTD